MLYIDLCTTIPIQDAESALIYPENGIPNVNLYPVIPFILMLNVRAIVVCLIEASFSLEYNKQYNQLQ